MEYKFIGDKPRCQFRLKPYWKEWSKRSVKYRNENTGTQMVTWDDIDWAFGGHSVTIPPEAVKMFIKEDLKLIYHRNNLTLKIFLDGHPATTESFKTMVETSKIQNFYAQELLAPRVYDVIYLMDNKNKYLAQVTDYIRGNFAFDEYDQEEYSRRWHKIESFGKDNGIACADLAHSNFKQGLFVDFQQFYFKNGFLSQFIEEVRKSLGFGDDQPYQSVEELDIAGKRNNEERYDVLSRVFEKDVHLLPEHFTALDFGCNGGYFLRRAFDLGAGYGMGIDRKNIIETTKRVTTYLGYLNADFFTEVQERNFDLVFFLSMDAHFPLSRIIPKVKKLLYLEGHAGDGHDEKKYREILEPYFKTVELIGSVNDCPEGEPRLWFRAVK